MAAEAEPGFLLGAGSSEARVLLLWTELPLKKAKEAAGLGPPLSVKMVSILFSEAESQFERQSLVTELWSLYLISHHSPVPQ